MSRYLDSKFAALLPYVPGEQPKDRPYIKLNANESPYPPSPLVLEALRSEEAAALNLYPDAACRELTALLAEHLGVGEGNILLANGSDDILNFCFLAFCERGVVFPDISYGFYEVFADLYHIDVLRPKMGAGLTIDPADYTGTGRCVVIANPNAQTGVALPLEAVEGIVKGSPESVVVVDEAYVDFGGETAVPLVGKYENVLVVRTFSKSASLAGARLGYAVGPEELIEDLKKLKYSTNPYSVNRTALIAGAAAIRDWSYSAENCRSIASERERLASELKARGFELTDSRTNFVLAKPRGIGAKEYMEALRERGILIRYLGGALADRVRITIGTPGQMDALLEATDEILKRS
ncbi:MAG: aminotransferase class I/II-fold pyridoxal phosphate-dependent enzyme [Oscillospiraceae bacterium]|nr:aminotransferase class I/II-fold pyridoxal phosphate-dependent enzyme [Oscillospiraceae bacterium]